MKFKDLSLFNESQLTVKSPVKYFGSELAANSCIPDTVRTNLPQI